METPFQRTNREYLEWLDWYSNSGHADDAKPYEQPTPELLDTLPRVDSFVEFRELIRQCRSYSILRVNEDRARLMLNGHSGEHRVVAQGPQTEHYNIPWRFHD